MLDNSEQATLKEIQYLSVDFLIKNKDENGKPYLQSVFELYQKIYGQTCKTCPSSIPIYIENLKNYKPMEKQEKTVKFKLKKGTVIPIAGTSLFYSEHNITDKIAAELLRQNPNRKILFASIPEDFDSKVKNKSPKVVEEMKDEETQVETLKRKK